MDNYNEKDFMSKQFKSLSICTRALMTKNELKLNNEKTLVTMKVKNAKSYLKYANDFIRYINTNCDDYDYCEEVKNRLSQKEYETATVEYYENYIEENKRREKELKRRLQEEIDKNVETTRELNLANYMAKPENYDEKLSIAIRSICLFENTLSRAIGIETNTFSDSIITIRVYHNSILKSLILNGFTWRGNKYIFYTCGAGALRTRKSVWMREDHYNKIENKIFNGLTIDKINKRGGHYVNKILAYRALPMSSTLPCNFLDIKRIAVVNDIVNTVIEDVDKVNTQSMVDKRKEDAYLKDISDIIDNLNKLKEESDTLKGKIDSGENVKEVRIERAAINKEICELKKRKTELIKEAKEWKCEAAKKWDTVETIKDSSNEIALADGIGLIRPVIKMPNGSKYKTRNFVIRAPWMKGLLAVFDFEKFLNTYQREDQTYVDKVTGKTYKLKKYECLDVWGNVFNVKDVDAILTASQLKTWNFYDSMDDYVENFIKNECELSVANMEPCSMSNSKKITYQMIQSLSCCATIDDIEKMASHAIDNIKRIGRDEETMLHIMGADKPYENSNWQQRSLAIYPELLKDKGIKEQMKQTKERLIREFIGGHFELGNAYYSYLIPDLFAVCQILFNVKPENGVYGLLKGNDIRCDLFNKDEEVIVDRNPALYFEHFYTKNKESDEINTWFTTHGIYCSANSMMTMVLCNDYDGDTGLISNNKVYVDCVKMHLNTYPRNSLAYNLQKADKTTLEPQSMYKGITSAYNANIGEISNRITILWNSLTNTSSEIYKKLAMYCIKIECAYNNQTIDFAKNLFLSEKTNKLKKVEEIVMNGLTDILVGELGYDSEDIDELINIIDSGFAHEILKEDGYTIKPVPSIKVPHFFTHIKDYSEDRVSPVNNSLVNKLVDIAPSEKIYFDECVKGNFKWRNLLPSHLDVKHIENDKELISRFNFLHKNKKKLVSLISEDEKYMNAKVNSYIIDSLLDVYGHDGESVNKNIEDICYILVKYIYTHNHEDRMNTIWNCFGRILYVNLKSNLTNTKRCEVCGKRFRLTEFDYTSRYCDKCKVGKIIEKNKKYNLKRGLVVKNA